MARFILGCRLTKSLSFVFLNYNLIPSSFLAVVIVVAVVLWLLMLLLWFLLLLFLNKLDAQKEGGEMSGNKNKGGIEQRKPIAFHQGK